MRLGARSEPEGMTEQDLRSRLDFFEASFAQAVQTAAERIVQAEDDVAIRRRTVHWKQATIPAVRRAASNEDPVEAFLDVWALCSQLHDLLVEGEGKEIFGRGQPYALETADALHQEIESIGASFLNPEELDRARAAIDAFVDENPIQGGFVRASQLPSSEDSKFPVQ